MKTLLGPVLRSVVLEKHSLARYGMFIFIYYKHPQNACFVLRQENNLFVPNEFLRLHIKKKNSWGFANNVIYTKPQILYPKF